MPASSDRLDRRVIVVSAVVVIGSFMSILDTTIVNVALATLSRELDSPLHSIQWVVTGYLVALALVIPMTGWASERFGAKQLYMLVIALFIAGSALSGLAWSAGSLIFCRILQGLGGGMIVPAGMTILAQAAGPKRIGRVMSVVGVAALLGPVLGPVVGGLLLQNLSWRWIFYVNVPVGVLALAAEAHEHAGARRRRGGGARRAVGGQRLGGGAEIERRARGQRHGAGLRVATHAPPAGRRARGHRRSVARQRVEVGVVAGGDERCADRRVHGPLARPRRRQRHVDRLAQQRAHGHRRPGRRVEADELAGRQIGDHGTASRPEGSWVGRRQLYGRAQRKPADDRCAHEPPEVTVGLREVLAGAGEPPEDVLPDELAVSVWCFADEASAASPPKPSTSTVASTAAARRSRRERSSQRSRSATRSDSWRS